MPVYTRALTAYSVCWSCQSQRLFWGEGGRRGGAPCYAGSWLAVAIPTKEGQRRGGVAGEYKKPSEGHSLLLCCLLSLCLFIQSSSVCDTEDRGRRGFEDWAVRGTAESPRSIFLHCRQASFTLQNPQVHHTTTACLRLVDLPQCDWHLWGRETNLSGDPGVRPPSHVDDLCSPVSNSAHI